MSTAQVARNGRARIRQPREFREVRKEAMPRDMIPLPDGTSISQQQFHRLRSSSHQKFREPAGLGIRIQHAIPATEWRKLLSWMDEHRARYGNADRQNDNFIAVLIDNAAARMRRNVESVLNDIIRVQSAHVLLSTVQ